VFSPLLVVLATLAQVPASRPTTTVPASQPAVRLRYRLASPLRLIYAGRREVDKFRRMRQGWSLTEEREEKFFSTVYVAPVTTPTGGKRLRVLILSVTILSKETAFGRDVTAETRRRPSRGRTVALDDYEIDDTGRLLPGATTRPAGSIFTFVAGRHVELPPLPIRPIVAGTSAQERLTAREGRFVVVRQVAPQPVEEDGRSCAHVSLQVRQEPGRGRFVVGNWNAEHLIDCATGLLMTRRLRLRYLVAPYRRDVVDFVKQVRRTPVSREAFDRASAELSALQATARTLADGDLDAAERQLADLARRFPEPAFEEKRAPLAERLADARALADPRTGRRRLHLPEFDTYFRLNVPPDYNPAKPCKLLILLHGAGGRPDGYFRSWITPLEGKPFILAAIKSRGHTWNVNADRAAITRLVEVLSAAYRIDREKVFLLGHSAGATMAYVTALTQKDVAFRGAVIAAGTLHRQVRGAIKRQTDQAMLDRARRLAFYVIVGANDRQFPPAAVKGDAALLKGAGAGVLYRELPDWGHAYPASENAAIADWLDKQ